MSTVKRLSLDDLARIATGIEQLSASDLVVSHYPDGEWSLGSPDNEWMTRKELQALSVELLERRALDAHRAMQPTDDSEEHQELMVEASVLALAALERAKERA